MPFYTWYGLRQALANDRLIAQLEADPELAKTHHRKILPWKPGWAKEVHVWPYLLRIEFLAAIIVTVILMVWSITLNAPLEELANPNLTMNPAKAPWYFLGLQEMLVYFDPWMAGVVMPTLIIVGLMVIPYIDSQSAGHRLLHLEAAQVRHRDVLLRLHGALAHHDRDRHVHSRAGMDVVLAGPNLGSQPRDLRGESRSAGHSSASPRYRARSSSGPLPWAPTSALAGWVIHKLITLTEFNRKIYQRMSLLQYVTMQIFLIIMLALPIKILMRLLFRIKYIWVTPWFNI